MNFGAWSFRRKHYGNLVHLGSWLYFHLFRKRFFPWHFRLHPEDLNAAVLNYTANTTEPGLSEIISVLVNKRPSSMMTSYNLLLKKLVKYQRENKSLKVKCHLRITLWPPEALKKKLANSNDRATYLIKKTSDILSFLYKFKWKSSSIYIHNI